MVVIACEPPADSALDPRALADADFKDAYRAPLTRDLAPADLFAAVFGHYPLGVKLVLIARNFAMGLCGLEVPTVDEIWRPWRGGACAVGGKIGPWPLFAVSDRELIAGRDNRHMDFRLSILKAADGASVTVSTICNVHNRFGRIYLAIITPFHRAGVRGLMHRAVRANRL